MGISNQGDHICLSGDVPNFDFWKSKFPITSHGIFPKDIEQRLKDMTAADDEFKVTLCLFLLGTILCPLAIDYVQTRYLIPLGDVRSIGTKNWSSWCFAALSEGIEKFQKNRERFKTCSISGCVLFLELFYLHSLQWDPSMVDKSVIPVVCWTNVKVRKCVTRLHTRGDSVDDVFEQPPPAEREYHTTAHGETSHANQQPGSVNNAHIKGMHDVLQVVKDIQATLKTELSDIRTKNISKSTPSSMNAPDSHMEDQRIDDLYHVPAVLTVPLLIDEDTLNDDNRELESISSNKRRTIQTRSTSKRKPSRYQISLYIAGHVHASRKYRYGPFRIGIQLNIYDEQLITYIFDKKLPSSEVIVDIGNLRVTRKSFRTLEPTKFLDSEIINLIPEYKTSMFKSKSSQLSWFLPTTYAYIVFTCAVGQEYTLRKSVSKLRESYMSDLRRCQKVYIPINDLRNHWYIVVFDLINRDCQVWDSKPPRRKEDLTRLNQVRKLSLDIVLADDIAVVFPTSFSFTDCSISYAEASIQPNGYDCDLFVCMFMDDNCPTPVQMKSFQSECQRLFWARFLTLFPGNTNLLTLKKNSQEHY
ncbi:hypothetical protein EZV62_022446 [Acer yangbiense]|uniref:Ubiquitin-like protease family profile domain-containing protein n=1 Tax=Acer yangbiense TaxID=1000413 RepID=A0A5C7H8E3_9ROSI|nr:hypothetical protein EZV62_022446 [Acer yangbiense]